MTKDILSNQLQYIQDCINRNTTKFNIELFDDNIELIKKFLYISTVYLCGRTVEDRVLLEFIRIAENKNDYSLKLNEEVINSIKLCNNLEEDDIERLVGKEEG